MLSPKCAVRAAERLKLSYKERVQFAESFEREQVDRLKQKNRVLFEKGSV